MTKPYSTYMLECRGGAESGIAPIYFVSKFRLELSFGLYGLEFF